MNAAYRETDEKKSDPGNEPYSTQPISAIHGTLMCVPGHKYPGTLTIVFSGGGATLIYAI